MIRWFRMTLGILSVATLLFIVNAHSFASQLYYENDFLVVPYAAPYDLYLPKFAPALGTYEKTTIQMRNVRGYQEATIHAEEDGQIDVFNIHYGVEPWSQLSNTAFDAVAEDDILNYAVPSGEQAVVPHDFGLVNGAPQVATHDFGLVGSGWINAAGVVDYPLQIRANALGGVTPVTPNMWVRSVSYGEAHGAVRATFDFTPSGPLSIDQVPQGVPGTRIGLTGSGGLNLPGGFDFSGILNGVQEDFRTVGGVFDDLGKINLDLNSLLTVETNSSLNIDLGGGLDLSRNSQIRLDGQLSIKIGGITLLDINPMAIIDVNGPGVIDLANTTLEKQGINAKLTAGPSGEVSVTVANGNGQIDPGTGGSVGTEENNSVITVKPDGSVSGNLTLGDEEYPVDLNLGGVANPGHSPGLWTVFGNIGFEPTATLKAEIAGIVAGTGYDWLDVQSTNVGSDGKSFLDGNLVVGVLDNFEQSGQIGSSEFAIITAQGGVFGEFDNVADGQRLTTFDGMGSFIVDYRSGSVVLMGFQAVPEPNAWICSVTAAATILPVVRRTGLRDKFKR